MLGEEKDEFRFNTAGSKASDWLHYSCRLIQQELFCLLHCFRFIQLSQYTIITLLTTAHDLCCFEAPMPFALPFHQLWR